MNDRKEAVAVLTPAFRIDDRLRRICARRGWEIWNSNRQLRVTIAIRPSDFHWHLSNSRRLHEFVDNARQRPIGSRKLSNNDAA